MMNLNPGRMEFLARSNARRARLRRAVLIVVIAKSAAIGCERVDDPNAYAPPPPPEVVVAHPVQREVTHYLTYTGVIEPSEVVELRARVQGFLESIHFQPGQRVRKGDLLFVIDRRQYQAALDQAEAAVRAETAALKGADNDARLARELADQRAGPEIDAIIKAARRDSIEANVARLEAEVAAARLNLNYCDITAPIDGRITRNNVDAGNLVGRGEPTLLATIVQTTPVFVSVDVSELDVLTVRRELERQGRLAQHEPGQMSPGEWMPCELALADQTEFTIPGRVDYVDPQINTDTGTLRVRTRFENTDELLLAGYFARIRFPMSRRDSMLVPDAALLSGQQGRYCMIVNEQSEVEVRMVQVGELDGSMRVVEQGLTTDDRVIVLGVLKARPRTKVVPIEQEAAASGR
jgi:RND family efflux transporter MFP subunit